MNEDFLAQLRDLMAANPGAPVSFQTEDGTGYQLDQDIEPYEHQGIIVIPITEDGADS